MKVKEAERREGREKWRGQRAERARNQNQNTTLNWAVIFPPGKYNLFYPLKMFNSPHLPTCSSLQFTLKNMTHLYLYSIYVKAICVL